MGLFDKIKPVTDEDKVTKNTSLIINSDENQVDPEDEELEEDEEENEDLEVEDETVEDKEIEDEDDEDVSPFKATIDYLAEEGVLEFEEDKEYEDSPETIKEVVEYTVEKRAEEKKEAWIESIPEDYRSVIKHLQAGRPLSEWHDAVVGSGVDDYDPSDEDDAKQLITAQLKALDYDDEDIEAELKVIEDSGNLEAKGKIAKKYLKKQDDLRKETLEKELEERVEAQKIEEEEAFDRLKSTVFETKRLGDAKLSKKDQQALLDHITKPVGKNGESQLMLNQSKVENQLLMAYLDMKGFKLEDLEKKAESKAAKNLREKLTTFTDPNAKRQKGSTIKDSKISTKLPSMWGGRKIVEDE